MTYALTLVDYKMVCTYKQTTEYGILHFIIHIVVCHNIYPFLQVSAHGISLLPADPALCVGDNVTFTCSLEDTATYARQVKPVLSSESLMTDAVINLLDTGKSEVTLLNVSNEHDHVAVCCIFDDDDDDICDFMTETSSLLNVYPLPVQVQNFTCLVENYNRSLKCAWDYTTTYERFKEPEVTLEWKSSDSPWMDCPIKVDSRNGYCLWESSQTDFAFRKIQMKISLKQRCGKSVESKFLTDTTKIVKPDPVVELSRNVINSTCIEIKWQSSDRTYPKRHTVIISCQWKDDQEIHFNTTSITEQLVQRRTLCDLHPFTTYTMVVNLLPVGNQSGYRSDSKVVAAVTYTDKPASSPKVIQGGYHWHRRDCAGNQNERRVCIFWKSLTEEEKNGVIESLPFTIYAAKENIPTNQSKFDDNDAYGCLDNVPCNAFNFTITARNVNGTSEQPSTLVISSATQGISQPVFYVEADILNKLYFNLEFSGTIGLHASDILVAWCHNHNGDCKRDSEVEWKNFAGDSEEVVVQLAPGDNPQDFLYGVSVVSEYGSSGVEWQECAYAKDKEPSREPVNVVIANGPVDNSLLVSWDKLDCKPGEPFLAMYDIQYSNLEDGIQKSQKTSATGEARLLIKDLEEDQTYVIKVRGVTKDGQYGPFSQPQSRIPLHKSYRSGTIVALSLGAFVGVVALVVGCYCILWTCKKKAAYRIQRAREITVPEFDNTDVDGPDLTTATQSMESGQFYSLNDRDIGKTVLYKTHFEATKDGSTNIVLNLSSGTLHRNVDERTPYVFISNTSDEKHAIVSLPCVNCNIVSKENRSDDVHCSPNGLVSNDSNEMYNSIADRSAIVDISNVINEMEDGYVVDCPATGRTAVVSDNESKEVHDDYIAYNTRMVTNKVLDETHDASLYHTPVVVSRKESNERNDGYVPHTQVVMTRKKSDKGQNESVVNTSIVANGKESNTSDEIKNGYTGDTPVVITSNSSNQKQYECVNTSSDVSNYGLAGSYIVCSYSASTNTSADRQTDDYHIATFENSSTEDERIF